MASPTPASNVEVNAGSLTQHPCVPTELHFVINQLASETAAPGVILVTFAGVSQPVAVPRTKVSSEDRTAHYTYTGDLLNTPVVGATAFVADPSWQGQFNLSHGPCF